MVLLSQLAIRCGACGLELKVNAEKSAATLAALRAYMTEYNQLEKRYESTVDGMTGHAAETALRNSGSRQRRAPRRRPRRRPKKGSVEGDSN